ncbi:MAG TPA: ABC transporter permease [Chloroflexota bacterium]|nr:ABC transporter permease [Chloroflexota bacterium]
MASAASELDPRPAQRSLRQGWRRGWYRFARNPTAVVGLVITVLVVLVALLAPLIAPFPNAAGNFVDFAHMLQAPSWPHIFGTDNAGRDMFSRVLFGYRISLLLVVFVLAVGVPIGVIIGLVAGYYGGWVEAILMRLTDVFLSVPPLVMAMAITAVLSPNLFNAMIAVTALWWTWHARLVHGITVSLKQEDYVDAARLMGASPLHIMLREILPNAASAILVKVTLDAGFVILIGAALSFLGLGVQPPQADLGTMVSAGVSDLPSGWWETVFPGLAIVVAVLGFNLLGDGLRDLFDVDV